MDNKKYIRRLLFLWTIAISLVALSACSKDSDSDDNLTKSGGITMKVDGELWSASMTTLISEQQENEEFGSYQLVSIMGTRVIDNNSSEVDDIAESITIYIAIPDSKFKNPKGIYPVVWQSSSKLNESTVIFGTAASLRDAEMYAPSESGQSGTIEISSFEIGDQKVMGYPTGTQGYTKLSGSFKMDLKPVGTTETNKSLKIAEGTFNLSGGMRFYN